MQERRLHVLPAVDGTRLVGIVTENDVEAAAASLRHAAGTAER